LWTVVDGPDEPIIVAQPAKPFHVAGDSLSLSCQAEGLPQPIVKWNFSGEFFSEPLKGVLNLTNVTSSQGGVYTCILHNVLTGERREKAVTVNIYGM